MDRRAMTVAILAMFLTGLGFVAGVIRTRQVLHDLAEEIAKKPQNSFARCLTESWEQSGELNPRWKGRRKWMLIEPTALGESDE